MKMNKELIITNETFKNLKTTKTLIGRADDLAKEHENFNDQYIVGGRRALYGLLAKMLDLVNAFEKAVDREYLLKLIQDELQNKYGIKTNGQTSITALLVRYVTRADRKKVHIYSRAIETARNNQINSAEFIDFIESQGGLEAIRANGVVSEQATIFSKKLEITKKYLQARAVYPLSSFKVSKKNLANIPNHKGLSLVLCHESQGRHFVIAGLPLDDKLNKRFMELMANNLYDDISAIEKKIEYFHTKAKTKRKKIKLREIVRKRPQMADSVLRASRIQQLGLIKSA